MEVTERAGARVPESSTKLRRMLDFWRRPSIERRRALTAYGFIAPSLFIIGVFVLWPMSQALYVSFMDYSVLGVAEWIGFDNYTRLVQDPAFLKALTNTFIYAAVTTPLSVGLALGLAMLLNRRLRGRGFFRSAIFLPVVTSLAIVAIAWSFLLNPDIGLLSYWLGKIGITSGNWLSDPSLAMPAVMMVGIWKNVGFYMVMYLAGLQAIPQDYYDAASVDGATKSQQFRYITWPLLANTTMFVFVIAAIATLQAFDQIFVMTRGGPFFSTETLVVLIYRLGFGQFEMGYASAISWVLVLLIFALSMFQLRYFRKRAVSF